MVDNVGAVESGVAVELVKNGGVTVKVEKLEAILGFNGFKAGVEEHNSHTFGATAASAYGGG